MIRKDTLMKNACALILLVLLLPALAFAAEKQEKHPIDKAQEDCMEKDWSTAGMANCTHKAEDMWDKELNRNYNALMKKLPPADREVLRVTQKKWLQFRDSEFRLIGALYGKLQGTMYIPMRASERNAFVRHRALDLAGYLRLAEDFEEEESGR